MILNFISLLFVFLSLIGWGYIFKSIFLKNEKFYNIDLFFGIFFLSLILIFLNFFFPLKYAFFPIIFLGLIFFIKLFYKKNCKINLFYFSIIIFFFCFISAHNPVQIDADLYHMQTIKWISEYKISFGLVNLEERLGVNSLWHLFISSFNVSKNLQLIFLLNIIPLSVLFYEVSQNLIKSNFKLPHLYLYFSLTFILFFSLIHPYNNGQIFNHLGTPENDTAAMVTILLSIYIFLINLESFDKKNFYLTNVLIALSILFKLSHIYLFVLILINFYI